MQLCQFCGILRCHFRRIPRRHFCGIPLCHFCSIQQCYYAVSLNELERLLSHLNSVEPSIQFTFERENERYLPFLDSNVQRTNSGNLEKSVYRKPTHTDKHLAFDSYHPICHKKSATRTLLMRADCFPSSDSFKERERHMCSVS